MSSLDNSVFMSDQVTQEVGDLTNSYPGMCRGRKVRARRAIFLETPHALILEDLKLPASLVMALESSSEQPILNITTTEVHPEQPGLPFMTMESSLEETALPVMVMESSPE